ncbi:hypothetical protein FB451DRAFT_1435195, partial [Mycena latifolia]
DFPVTIWAAHRLGASILYVSNLNTYSNTENPTYTVSEYIPHLVDMKPSLLVVYPSALDTVQTAATRIGLSHDSIRSLQFSGGERKLNAHVATLVESGPRPTSSPNLKPGQGKTKVALYFPSSGTTGVPTMVAIPHTSFISNIIRMMPEATCRFTVVDRRFRPGTFLVQASIKLCLNFGLLIRLFSSPPLLLYMSVVIAPKFDFAKYLATIKKYKVTHLSLVPPMLTLFCKHPAVIDADLSSLRVVFVGGAPFSVPLAKNMGQIVPQAVVEQGYDMTELTRIVTMPPLNRRVATDAVGHLVPGFTARVVKPEGSLAGIGESSELYVTGPSLAIHYVNNEKISLLNSLTGNWVRTGDEVYFNENGELHIVDRIKDFIKVGGFQVAPAEIEARRVTNMGGKAKL